MTKAVKPTGAVHPVAELFPMLSADDLQELADGIREHGLLEPIVLDADGVLIDGRNRLAACQIAGVDPDYETLNGTDPVAYIVERNIHRRHLSIGQRALLVAQAELSKNARKLQPTKLARRYEDIGRVQFSEAFTILEFAPEMVPSIMDGTTFLSSAYTVAQQRKQERLSDEERTRREAADLARLERDAPDLHRQVTEWSLQLSDALAALAKREQDVRDRHRRETIYFGNHASMLWSLLHPDPAAFVERWVDGAAETLSTDHLAHLRTGDGLRQLAGLITDCAGAVDARGGLS